MKKLKIENKGGEPISEKEKSAFFDTLRGLARKSGATKVAGAVLAFLAVESAGVAHADDVKLTEKNQAAMMEKIKADHPDIAEFLDVVERETEGIAKDSTDKPTIVAKQ